MAHEAAIPMTAPRADFRRAATVVVVASALALAAGFAPMPFWDEDEPRFAAIARTMLETGDWIVPRFNDTLAVDKPVLMHWCMAACFRLFGVSEISARLPAAVATLAAALALTWAGARWFDPRTGVVAALAWVGCLLVGIEAHAATPDAILTALTAWMTVLATDPLLGAAVPGPARRRLPLPRAALVGALGGLGVLCKGPVGFVGPLGVIVPFVALVEWSRRRDPAASLGRQAVTAAAAVLEGVRFVRPVAMVAAMLAVAAPWYVAVGVRTAGEWPAGFFLVHNVGRFAAPMENHGGGILFHALAMLVGFFPWSCFLPFAVAVSAWRVSRRDTPTAERRALSLALLWLAVWVGTFSLAATKLPNYVLPAYPAAALVVAATGTRLVDRGRAALRGWLAAGLGWMVFGGVATAVTVLVAERYGLAGAAPAAVVGAVPILGALACLLAARGGSVDPVAVMAATGLVFSSLAVGPAAARISSANALPGLVAEAHRHAGGLARVSTYGQNTPNLVYYARGHVNEWRPEEADRALADLAAGDDRVLVVTEEAYRTLEGRLPPGRGVVARRRPLFKDGDFLVLGTIDRSTARSAAAGSSIR